MNAFYQLAEYFEKFNEAPSEKTSVNEVLSDLFPGIDSQDARLRVLFLVKECRDLTIASDRSEVRSKQRFDYLQNLLTLLSRHLNLGRAQELSTQLNLGLRIETIRGYGDTYASILVEPPSAIRRDQLIAEIEDLRGSLLSNMRHEYTKKFLEISLNQLVRVVLEDATYSDTEVRLRIKSVYADFCLQIDQHDEAYKSVLEKITGLARKYSVHSLGLLAIASDVSQIAGLLPAP